MNFRTIVLAALPLTTAGSAVAHDMSSPLTATAAASDYFQVTCQNDEAVTEHLFFRLSGSRSPSAPPVSAQITKGALATNVTVDPAAGFSREVEIHGGGGDYYVTVNKSKAGRANYGFEYHCQSATGVHTGTDTVTLQNQ